MVKGETSCFSMKSDLSRHRMSRIVIIFPQSIWMSHLFSSNNEPFIMSWHEQTFRILIVEELVAMVPLHLDNRIRMLNMHVQLNKSKEHQCITLTKHTSMYDFQYFTYFFGIADPSIIYFGLVNNLATDFKFIGIFSKSIQFYKQYFVAFVFVMLTLFESFIADKDLVGIIILISWVSIVHSMFWSVVSVFVCIFKFGLFPQNFLMNQSTCDCIPETHHVVPVDSSEQVVLLLPD